MHARPTVFSILAISTPLTRPNPFLHSLGSGLYDADGQWDEQLGQGGEAESHTDPGAMPEPLSVADTNPQDADIADTMPTPR